MDSYICWQYFMYSLIYSTNLKLKGILSSKIKIYEKWHAVWLEKCIGIKFFYISVLYKYYLDYFFCFLASTTLVSWWLSSKQTMHKDSHNQW